MHGDRNTPGQLPPPWFRRLVGHATDAAALVVLVYVAVMMTALVNLGVQESEQPSWDFGGPNLAETVSWCAFTGTLALLLGLLCFRRKAWMFLAGLSATAFFVLVVAIDVVDSLREFDGAILSARPIRFEHMALLVVVVAPVLWNLRRARPGMLSRPAKAGAAVSLGLITFAGAIWVFGGTWLGLPAGQLVQAEAAPQHLAPSWDNIRKVIADGVGVPEDQVMPDTRFDDLQAREADMYEMTIGFEPRFGTHYETGDETMFITVQDAIDYIASPDDFRAAHRGQNRYSHDRQ